MLAHTVHGQVEVTKPWYVIEFRNGFRNAIHQFDSESQARSWAVTKKEDAKLYRATLFQYEVKRSHSEVPA